MFRLLAQLAPVHHRRSDRGESQKLQIAPRLARHMGVGGVLKIRTQ